jgi:hypothetical protein
VRLTSLVQHTIATHHTVQAHWGTCSQVLEDLPTRMQSANIQGLTLSDTLTPVQEVMHCAEQLPAKTSWYNSAP